MPDDDEQNITTWIALRDEIETIEGSVKALEALPRSREIALAITKLQEASLWLGSVLP